MPTFKVQTDTFFTEEENGISKIENSIVYRTPSGANIISSGSRYMFPDTAQINEYVDGTYSFYDISTIIDGKPVFLHNNPESEKAYLKRIFSGTKYENDSTITVLKLIDYASKGDPESWRMLSYICFDAWRQAEKMSPYKVVGVDFEDESVLVICLKGDSVYDIKSLSFVEYAKNNPLADIKIDGYLRSISQDRFSIINIRNSPDTQAALTQKCQEVAEMLKNKIMEQHKATFTFEE